jgi:hypothetical protein
MLTTVASSTTISCASPTVARVHHRRDEGAVAAGTALVEEEVCAMRKPYTRIIRSGYQTFWIRMENSRRTVTQSVDTRDPNRRGPQ